MQIQHLIKITKQPNYSRIELGKRGWQIEEKIIT